MKLKMNDLPLNTLGSVMLLTGSFTFAFLLGEMVHEFGHYLAHLAYGNPHDVLVHLDPFGGSKIVGVTALPLQVMSVTSVAGPLFNLALAWPVFILLLRKPKPVLLPLLLWGPVAMVQEGVTLSLGLLMPGGDAQWIAAAGIPAFLILVLGMLSLIAGVVWISWLLPLAGIVVGAPFRRKGLIMVPGIGSLMLIRAIHSFWISPAAIIENLLPLFFSLLLSLLIVLLQRPVTQMAGKVPVLDSDPVPMPAVSLSLLLGASMFGLQIVL